ncbi:MAG: hypothetical protein ACKVWV_16850 [Planctomycetota bacterium]
MIRASGRIAVRFVLASSTPFARAQCPDWAPGFNLPGSDGVVRALCVFDDGSGPALYVGGSFNAIGPIQATGLARYDGTDWSTVGGSLPILASNDPTRGVYALTVFDDGNGPALYASGFFETIGGVPANCIARWDGSAWSALNGGLSGVGTPIAYAMAVFHEPGEAAPSLFVGGRFTLMDGVAAGGLAKWDGAQWTLPGSAGGSFVYALTVHDDGLGGGLALYAGGDFTFIDGAGPRVAKFDGSTWTSLSNTPANGYVRSFASFDPDGVGPVTTRLYAGGTFQQAGRNRLRAIAEWNGSAWSDVGGTGSIDFNGLHVLDDGSDPALFAIGSFTAMGGVSAHGVAKWNGNTWAALGSGISGGTDFENFGAMAQFDDGSGSAIFVGGDFDKAGGSTVHDLARWSGSAWSIVAPGSGADEAARSVEFSSVGSTNGEVLYAGGEFTSIGGATVLHIAKWDGTSWSALGTGLTPHVGMPARNIVRDMIEFDDGSGRALYVCGSLLHAGGIPAQYIARWSGSAWSAVGSSLPFPAYALAVYDDGTGGGPALFAAGNLSKLWRWNGTTWSDREGIAGDVNAMIVHDDGSGNGPELYLGGSFTQIGPVPANRVAKWRGSACGPCGTPLGTGMNGIVKSFVRFDEQGTGQPLLFAGGLFQIAGGVSAFYVARWDGSSWSALGSGPSGQCEFLTVFDDGSGPALYSGGKPFSGGAQQPAVLEKWNGSTWELVDLVGTHSETSGSAELSCAAVGSLGGARSSLFVGGAFTWAGDVATASVAQYVACDGEPGVAFCFGDGSLATACPCVPPNTIPNPSGGADGGCANSFVAAGGKLVAEGLVNPDSVVLRVTRVTPAGFCVFMGANGIDASGIAFGDGVRCARGSFVRFGGQFAAAGMATYPNPDVGHVLPLHAITSTTVGSGQTISYQVLYRNATFGFCSPSTFNLTNAYSVTWN